MFAFFESRIRPTRVPSAPPPQGLIAFYWHFVRQTRGLYAAMFVTGLAVALIDTSIPVFIGRLVGLMQTSDRLAAFHDALAGLVGMTTVREANDRGYECVVLSDCVGSYFPEFQRVALEMTKAQGALFGWVSDSARALAALRV